jgi:hypothetical protein
MTSQPSSSQEISGSHGITVQVDAVALEKMRKEGTTDDGFTIYCDEGSRLGGLSSATTPLRYFCLAVAF